MKPVATEDLPTLALCLLTNQSIRSRLAVRFEASLETGRFVMTLQCYYAKGNLLLVSCIKRTIYLKHLSILDLEDDRHLDNDFCAFPLENVGSDVSLGITMFLLSLQTLLQHIRSSLDLTWSGNA